MEDDLKVKDDEKTAGATLEESIYFVRESGIDAFAPAIGTAHGVYKGTPRLISNWSTNSQAIDTPIVIHGEQIIRRDFSKADPKRGAKINVSTALKHGYIDDAGNIWKRIRRSWIRLILTSI